MQRAERAARIAEEAAARAKKLGALKLGSFGERKLGEWLEESGRKLVLDPRNKAVTARGADAITVYWEDGKCIVEFWDNKAWTSSRTVSGSSALEKLGESKGAMRDALEKALGKSDLTELERTNILKALDEGRGKFSRVVSNAGGRARPGPSLERKGIRFEEIDK